MDLASYAHVEGNVYYMKIYQPQSVGSLFSYLSAVCSVHDIAICSCHTYTLKIWMLAI